MMAQSSSTELHTVPAHLAGLTRICFSTDGDTMFTGGLDSLVRIHKTDDPQDEPGIYDMHEGAITSITCSDSVMITAAEDNISRIFSYPENELQGYLTRATAVPIRWVSIDRKGERVAVVSDDLLVKIVNVQDTSKVSFLSDNVKAVRSASWSPSGQHLVTVGCDGRVKVYDMTADTPVHLRNIDGAVNPSKSDSTISAYAAWHPSGKYFALPLRTNDIGIYSSTTWQRETTFSQDGHKGIVGELAWSPNGRYLASSSGSQILVWETESRSVVASLASQGSDISALQWSPRRNLIAFAAMDGYCTRWIGPVPKNLTSPTATEQQEKRRVDRLLDDDDEGDVDMEDRGEELGDDEDGEEGDWIVDDEGGYGVDDAKWGKGRTEVVNVTKAQPPFTPGSTAYRNKKRYLAFNMIGVVDCTDIDTHQVINVEFHDKSSRRGYHFQDHSGYTMASLGEQGIAYAAPSSDSGPSTVHYRPYDSWATQSDWTQTLPAGEVATCIAVGGPQEGAGIGSVIVSTSRGLVRFFTASGVQRYIWRLGEDVVCMAAGRDALTVVYREGGTTLDGCQNLRYTILDLENFDILQQGGIPLQRKATLTWLGWSGEGSPVMADSTGVLSQLDRYRRPGQGRWVPILDGTLLKKENKGQTCWPVGVNETNLSCIMLGASQKEPWFPRPLLQSVDLQVPLLSMDGQTGKLEESIIRHQLNLSLQTSTLSSSADHDARQTRVTIDKELLQLIQSACKSDNLARAYDLANLLLNPGSVDSAAKIAAFYHLGGLEERILGLKGEAAVRARREEKRSKEREKERERRYGADHSVVNGAVGDSKRGMDLGFQPRDKPRRSFGGVKAGVNAAQLRAETPQNGNRATGRETYIPETPSGLDGVQDSYMSRGDDSMDMERQTSPESKRKRADEEDFAPRRKLEEVPLSNGATAGKNPFAKKVAAGNPFAKPAASKPLDAIKSKSFFARVDDIESTGTAKSKSKTSTAKHSNGDAASGQRQTTLLGMKKGTEGMRPSMQHASSTETEGGATATEVDESEPESMLDPAGFGGKRNGVIVEETQLVDEPEEETQVDEPAPVREASPDWDEDAEETYL